MIGKIEQLSDYPKPVFGGFEPNSLKKQIMDLQKRVEELEKIVRELKKCQ